MHIHIDTPTISSTQRTAHNKTLIPVRYIEGMGQECERGLLTAQFSRSSNPILNAFLDSDYSEWELELVVGWGEGGGVGNTKGR